MKFTSQNYFKIYPLNLNRISYCSVFTVFGRGFQFKFHFVSPVDEYSIPYSQSFVVSLLSMVILSEVSVISREQSNRIR